MVEAMADDSACVVICSTTTIAELKLARPVGDGSGVAKNNMSGANSVTDYNYSELEAQENFLGEILTKSRDAVCSCYSGFREWYFGTRLPITQSEKWISDFWFNLCPDVSPPTFPPPPFFGGQCSVAYGGTYVVNKYYSNGTYASETKVIFDDMYGPISGIRATPRPEEPGQFVIDVACAGVPGAYSPETGWYRIGIIPTGFVNVTVASFTPVRRDAQPDNCGDPAATPPTPVKPPTSTTNTFINTTYGDTNIQIPVSISPTLNFNYIDGINIPVTIKLGDFNLNPSFNPTFNVALNADFSLKPVLNAKFSLNGVNISFGGGDSNLLPGSPAENAPVEKKNIKLVRVQLTAFPDKAQFSPTGAPVYFAGWIAFKRGAYRYPREQLNFENSSFVFPEGADSYEVTFTNGAEGIMSETTIEV